MNTASLHGWMQHFAKARILCVGDVMLDKFVYGTVERISPESPVPIFAYHHEETMLGGAGNVVRNVASLGGQAGFISMVGADAIGHQLTRLVGQERGLEPYIVTESGRISTEKTRYVAASQQLLRADKEALAPIKADTADKILEIARTEIAKSRVLVLSDYGKGVLTRPLVAALINLAKTHQVPVLVDPKQRDFSYYQGASVISPNLKELLEAAGLDKHAADTQTITQAAAQLCKTHAIGHLLVTRGKDGMMLCNADGLVHQVAASAHEVFDVSGAGDTSLATLALTMAAGAQMVDAMQLANIAAGIAVTKLGTAAVHADELARALHDAGSRFSDRKIMAPTHAAEVVSKWRAEGKQVGFTNGCFDIMHAGHVSLLHDAKSRCDKLVIGLNTDASVRRLKGDARPVNQEDDRAQLLASLSMVDMVVLFDDDTPLQLIETLKPAVLMKGADYTVSQVVGHEIVQAYGGRVELIPLKDGYSTTGIIKKAAMGS